MVDRARWWTGLVVLLLAGAALAGPKEDARKLNDEGAELLKSSDSRGARTKFEGAYAIFQHEVIALNVALTSLHLEEYEKAFEWLWKLDQASLKEDLKAKYAKIHDVAKQQLGATRGILRLENLPKEALIFVDGQRCPSLGARQPRKWLEAGDHSVVVISEGRHAQLDVTIAKGLENPVEVRFAGGLAGTVLVECGEPGALVFVNGRNYGEVRSEGLTLGPGAYALAVRKDGFKEFATKVTVASGETARVNARLEKAAGVVVTQLAETKPGAEATPGVAARGASKGLGMPGLWSWVTMGTGAALVIGGGVMHGLVVKDANDLNGQVNDKKISSEKYTSEFQSKVTDKGPAIYALYGVGGAAVATGLALWLAGVPGFTTATSGPSAQILPMLLPGGAGAGVVITGF